MNKFFNKIIGASLAIAMMIGVGVGISANKGVKEVNATGKDVTYQHIFNAKPTVGNDTSLSGVSWKIAATNLGSYNSQNYAGVQFGTKNDNGSITLTSNYSWGEQTTATAYYGKTTVTEIRLWLNLGGTSVTPSVTVGGVAAVSDGTTVVKNSSAGNDYTKATKVTFTPAVDHDTGVVVISVTSVKAGYICAVEIDSEEPSQPETSNVTTSLTVSPTSWSGYTTDVIDTSDFTVSCTTTGSDDGYSFLGIGHMNEDVFVPRIIDFSSGNPDVADTKLCWKAKYPTTANGTEYLYAFVDLTVTEDVISSVSVSGNLNKTTYFSSESWKANGLVVTATRISGKQFEATENVTFKYYTDVEMTQLAEKPVDLGVGNNKNVFIKATYSGISNIDAYPQTISIIPCISFVSGSDKGNASGQNQADTLTKGGVSLHSDSCYTSSGAYRFYSKATLTISSKVGNITRIEFNTSGGNYTADLFSLSEGSSGSYDSSNSNQGVWTGDATTMSLYVPGSSQARCTSITVVFKEAAAEKIESELSTQASLAYNYHKDDEGNFTYSNIVMRFGGNISKDLWNRLDDESTITGFGVILMDGDMVKSQKDATDAMTDMALSTVTESLDEHMAIEYFVPVSNMAVIGQDENNYFWNLRVSVADTETDKLYSAVAYIKVGDEYVLMNMARTSIVDIALDYLVGGTYNGTTAGESLQGIVDLTAE